MTLIFEPFGPLYEVSSDPARQRASAAATIRPFIPPADVVVTDEAIMIYADVPGLTAADITVELDNEVVMIRGERPLSYTAEDQAAAGWMRIERAFGSFERSLRVPRGVNADAVEASMANGVLTVRIPMPAARHPRRVDVVSNRQRSPEVVEGSAAPEPAAASAAAGTSQPGGSSDPVPETAPQTQADEREAPAGTG